MNKYFPVIARAVERLDTSTGETRRTVYERAREAIARLRSNQPALLDADIIKECLTLEEAIREVEAEAVRNSPRETWAEPQSALPSGGPSDCDKIQSGDHGQPASPDRDDQRTALASRQAPIVFPTASDHWHNTDIQAVAIGGAYGADHYYDDVPSPRWRGGFLVMLAVLALAMLAGTFAYRGMFGSSMFAALPPILKGVSRPDNIVRNNSDTVRGNSSQTSVTSAGSSEKLPPIDIREAPKMVPRVISAIPISSQSSAGAIASAPPATMPALDPAVALALDQHIAPPVPPPAPVPVPVVLASSEPNETAVTAPATREQGAPTPALGPPVLTAVPVSPAASAPAPVQISSEPTETAAAAPAAPTLALRPPVLTALSAPPLLFASAPVPVPAFSATESATAPAALEQGASTPALGLPALTAASVPPPASAPMPVLVSSEPSETTPTAPAPLEQGAPLPAPAPAPAIGPPPASAPVPVQVSSDPKKIGLVTVEDRWGQTDTSSLAGFAPNTAAPAASAAAASPVGNHGVHEDAAPLPSSGAPVRATAAEVSSGGAYAVQLASESSAAEAHASFRALRSKFPNQLGGREPIVRRTDLGAKGVYYRLTVGPFASMEKAAGMCSTLKAAGCNCLVQRN
jgi:SPOR domain